jgi:hypothetical protein
MCSAFNGPLSLNASKLALFTTFLIWRPLRSIWTNSSISEFVIADCFLVLVSGGVFVGIDDESELDGEGEVDGDERNVFQTSLLESAESAV